MAVTVHIPTPLRAQVGEQAKLELEGATIREVLAALTERYPKLRGRLLNQRDELNRFVNVFLNEEDIRFLSNLDTPVKAGDGIMIVPAIAGGCATGPDTASAAGGAMPEALDLPALVRELAAMPERLRVAAQRLGERALTSAPPDGFCLVEHAWHLADLEREGYQPRLRALLSEEEPFLPDFDGARVARERQYRTRPLAAGIDAFAVARAATLELLASVPEDAWTRAGTQEGVGRVTLADVARAVLAHDREHARDIAALEA